MLTYRDKKVNIKIKNILRYLIVFLRYIKLKKKEDILRFIYLIFLET